MKTPTPSFSTCCMRSKTEVIPEHWSWDKICAPSNSLSTILRFGLTHRTKCVPVLDNFSISKFNWDLTEIWKECMDQGEGNSKEYYMEGVNTRGKKNKWSENAISLYRPKFWSYGNKIELWRFDFRTASHLQHPFSTLWNVVGCENENGVDNGNYLIRSKWNWWIGAKVANVKLNLPGIIKELFEEMIVALHD